ncbi:PREDICTED: pro-FMRFamide-related neuropeptide FF [Chrysochloris asiatica]|uniref:Pro-FMRFamide-related neuropeptide FF n=1 Tax=Chrysochloris asiatica TaxID=185453 RepID=A0A9B0WWV9_CHRAS|nr:PREDICTED: pro-FMRFamide-related neuropeptide FF [Chrysochloris asiatica]
MDSRRASVLLVLLLLIADWGHTKEPGDQNAYQTSVEEDNGLHTMQDTQAPGSLLGSLLQAMQRSSRSPAFLFQPQRFGRNTRGSWGSERLSPRAWEGLNSQFWSLAAPQRFGKK